MAIGAITMILANVGLQIYNNWCGSRQNAALQQKREEFERAAKDRNKEHMWRLLREGQEIALQLENEKHADRLKELKDEVDHLLEKLTYETTISNWPLKVLPIVMKNQAFGNLLANQEENVAMHVIFTRSNYDKFNKLVYPIVEKQLELYCDKHWSTMTDHPILFYSGAWKPMVNPTDVQVTAMREELKNLPTLLITPFFRPGDGKLVFLLHMWGVGANSTDKFDVPEIEPTNFQRPFNNQDDYDNEEGLLEEIVEDLVPYLECMIGYMADTYFWSSAGLAPHLPLLLTSGAINTDGMKYLVEDAKGYFERLAKEEEQYTKYQPFAEAKALSLYDGTSCFYQDDSRKVKLESIFISYCSQHTARNFHSMTESLDVKYFAKEDLPFIRKFRNLYQYDSYQKALEEIQTVLEAVDFDYSILESTDIAYLEKLANEGNGAAMFRLGEIYEFSIGVNWNPDFSNQCYKYARKQDFILSEVRDVCTKHSSVDKTSLAAIELLSEQGIEQAIILMAQMRAYGIGCEGSIDEAISLLNKVKVSCHPYYYYFAAQLLLEEYSEEERKTIFLFLKKSADLGYVKAQEKVMMIYVSDIFVPQNPESHFYYAKLAAMQGSLSGLTRTGLCLAKGYGISKSIGGAQKVLSIAAKRNYPDAIKLLKILEDATK